MLRITPMNSAVGAKDYFNRALSRGEYYGELHLTSQEIVGRWGGRLAKQLGLRNAVSREAFDRLCDNLHPRTGEKLTPRTKDNRRVGYDINFHVPKSVSTMLELGGDRRILHAFREAVADTMREMERGVRTRVRKNGSDTTRKTASLLYADYVHFTARPVDGHPDPHLHAHCVAFNVTWDPAERRYKAADFGDLKRDAPYHQAWYHARLAEKLVGLGYRIVRKDGGWEISGVPESVMKGFSRRTEQVERAASDRNISDAARKAELGAQTREAKLDLLSMQELRQQWRSRLSPQEQYAIRRVRAGTVSPVEFRLDREEALENAMGFGLGHAFEKQSVISQERLLAAALEAGVGSVTPDGLRRHYEDRAIAGDVMRCTSDEQVLVTTPAVYEEEQAMLAWARDGRGRHDPLNSKHQIRDTEMSAEQRAAVSHVLESSDAVILIRGRAGVGKTRTMREVVDAIAAMGKAVQATAPTAMATHEVLRSDGFSNARTVASLLKDPNATLDLHDQVIWVDEAGLVSVPDMVKLAALAKDANARLILTGDTAQHRSVIRGDALRLLENASGLRPAHLTEIRRQQTPEYRRAAELLAKGELQAGYERLDAMGALEEVPDADRPEAIAQAFFVSVNGGRTTLAISPTHAEGAVVTNAIRDKLRAEGLIAESDATVTILVNRHLSEAERQDPAAYRPGDVIVFEQHAGRGLKRGSRAEVIETKQGRVQVSLAGPDSSITLPLNKAARFQVHEPRELRLAKGDRIRFTHGGKTVNGKHRVHNGSIQTFDGMTKNGTMRLGNGWELDGRFGHLTHGYCVTSDAAQGRNVQHVILAQSAESAAAASTQQFYTSVTRGKQRISVFTDDKQQLLRAVSRDTSRMSATELVGMSPPTPETPARSLGLWLSQQRQRLQRTISRARGTQRARSQSQSRGAERPRGRSVSQSRNSGGVVRER